MTKIRKIKLNIKNKKLQLGDDHSLWEEAFEEQEKNSSNKQQKKQENQESNNSDEQEMQPEPQDQSQEYIQEEQIEENFDEKQEFENNRKEKREKFKSNSEKTKKDIREKSKDTIRLNNIGESKEEIDWKVLLRREVEKTETIWSQRRSIAENNYAYRLEENDIEDEAETEVMIDVSGSVEENLVKAFLRQLKPLLNESKLKVGFFDHRFFDFVEIKKMKDIDNLHIPNAGGGTNLDLPVRSFSKKREINKIIFTDGYSSDMPEEDLKRENVIWLVYGNKYFEPCCGKVINITERQLQQLNLMYKKIETEDISR